MEDNEKKSAEVIETEIKIPNNDIENKGISDVGNLTEEPEIVRNMPHQVKETFMALMGPSKSFLSPLASKINEKHIDKLIELDESSQEREFKILQQSKRYQLFYILIAVFVFAFLTLFLVGKDTELFKELVKLFIIFVGGMGAGFGIKFRRGNK